MPDPRMSIVEADITRLKVDAIVNAANASLLGGGGVDGAIHRAAGPQLLEECRLLGGCPTGEARITHAYALPAKWVIHAVGPVWRGGGHDEERLLAACYARSLTLGVETGAQTIAFSAISTGIFAFPKDLAARIAVQTVHDWLKTDQRITKVVFCCFGEDSMRAHRDAWNFVP
jgi:O-acetyl-ADP-ribose deacetylase (regulator of RNase III)